MYYFPILLVLSSFFLSTNQTLVLNTDLNNLFFKPFGLEARQVELCMDNFTMTSIYFQKESRELKVDIAYKARDDTNGYLYVTDNGQINGKITHIFMMNKHSHSIKTVTAVFHASKAFKISLGEFSNNKNFLTLINEGDEEMGLTFIRSEPYKKMPIYLYKYNLTKSPGKLWKGVQTHQKIFKQMQTEWTDEKLTQWKALSLNSLFETLKYSDILDREARATEQDNFLKLVVKDIVLATFYQHDLSTIDNEDDLNDLKAFFLDEANINLLVKYVARVYKRELSVNFNKEKFQQLFLKFLKSKQTNFLAEYFKMVDEPMDNDDPKSMKPFLRVSYTEKVSKNFNEEGLTAFVKLIKLRMAWIFYVVTVHSPNNGQFETNVMFTSFEEKATQFYLSKMHLGTPLEEIKEEIYGNLIRFSAAGVLEVLFHMYQLENLDEFLSQYSAASMNNPDFAKSVIFHDKNMNIMINLEVIREFLKYQNVEKSYLTMNYKEIQLLKEVNRNIRLLV